MEPTALSLRAGKRLAVLAMAGGLGWSLLHPGHALEPPERPPVRVSACLSSDTQAHPIRVELARTPAQKQFGLMERDSLPPNAGMLFIYDEPRPPSHSFWMYKTRIPLDIAFIGENGEIRAIQSMVPCTSAGTGCPSYPAGVPFTLALEMNRGYFERKDIRVGDRFSLVPPSQCQ
ncbi:MAG: DUF192 domain-containing protein [Marinobacter sp.]|uniref:DUF192 domain-containing protein n=1 Tax=Marinobacter sp. TaxID=50741 RepID=UPI00299E72F5|nr:DUF192 domain-containing protein [Marinobacter sp.]MDX1634090.1 DUF192 domain-containing protein [Marinobacter sp.]